jgi:dihydrofolate synthase / folylpolyglutamate synthase
MNYAEAIQYLYSLGNETLAMKPGLHAICTLSNELGQPQKKYPAVHIAGTNGKGSTAAMTAAMARAAGVRTGLYTSPHLVSPTERMSVDGVEIDEATFAHLATAVRIAGERLVEAGELEAPPTFFEQVTMIAWLYFAEREVELAVLEVGLGGRLDATNICLPVVTAITTVDFDHQKQLGWTLREIAGEKAGILKAGVPVIVSPQAGEAWDAIEARAAETGAPLLAVSVPPEQESEDARDDFWNAGRPRIRYASRTVRLALRGRHQRINAACAIRIAETLRETGFPIPSEAIVAGLERAQWPGRLELHRAGDRGLLLDGAHNASGARVLAESLQAHCAARPVTLLFAAMADKAIADMAAALFPLAARIIVTQADNRRGAPPPAIAAIATKMGRDAMCVDRVADALAEAWRATPADGLICVCGSLFLVGEVKPLLRALGASPVP